MTRTLYPRSSRKKPLKEVENIENSKENVPVSQKKKCAAKNKSLTLMKENVSPNNRTFLGQTSVDSCKSLPSPIRKSVRRTAANDPNKHVKIVSDRNVLRDKTNSCVLPDTLQSPLDRCSEKRVIRNVESKNKIIPSQTGVESKNKSHVPVYKHVEILEVEVENRNPLLEKNEAVYDFEVDENEEPVHKKKRKKRVYNKKPKLGPRALTINNIKYSSSESLVSLPEKPVARKKKTSKNTKTNFKPVNLTTNLTSVEDSSCSINSFMSHPPSMRLCGSKNTNAKRDLSVLVESQSELNASLPASGDQEELLTQPTSPAADSRVSFVPPPQSPQGDVFKNPWGSDSVKTYHAKSPSVHNISNTSSHDFLSSTPCKRTSAVVCNNSVFDDSYDLPNSVRQSSGYSKNNLTADGSLKNCFGFDEPEELEEPLISPIKINIDLGPRWAVKKMPHEPLEPDTLKPSAQEVIELLKASIPKDIYKQRATDVYDAESENVNNSLPPNNDEEVVGVCFTKPPRRSYERQRRIRHKSESAEETEKEDCNEEKNDEVENAPKAVNKCYKKMNTGTTKSAKPPKVTKAKQRIAKEEMEMERLAALMNAQFQEIEKVSLVVE